MHRLRALSRGVQVLLALAVGGALFGIATAVQADIPDSGVIHGCYAQFTNGALRVIDTSKGQKCLSTEGVLSWNQTGPRGPAGPTGATGATGPTGPGVKTIAGRVFANGSIAQGSGFSVTRTATGIYSLTFPPGTWSPVGCTTPVATVTPWVVGVARTANLAGAICENDGTVGVVVVFFSVGSSPALIDSDFSFIAAQP